MSKKTKAGFKAVTVKPTRDCKVSVAEHRGRVEVVLEKGGQRLRLLGDLDGIHVGSLVEA